MVYCVRAVMAFSTANRRNNIRSAIETRISGRERWSLDLIESRPIRGVGANGLYVELRFVSRADQEDLDGRLQTLFSSNPPLAGSFVRLHDCSHDDGTNECTVTLSRDW